MGLGTVCCKAGSVCWGTPVVGEFSRQAGEGQGCICQSLPRALSPDSPLLLGAAPSTSTPSRVGCIYSLPCESGR